MLGKHIHAPKRFDTQHFIMHFLPPCICLAFNSKKKSHLLCFRHNSRSVVSPFQVRCKSVPITIGSWELHRRNMGGRVNLLFLTLWEWDAASFIHNSITIKWHICEVTIDILNDFKECVCTVWLLIVERLDRNTVLMFKDFVEKSSIWVATHFSVWTCIYPSVLGDKHRASVAWTGVSTCIYL